MANPAADLFNDATLGAAWTVRQSSPAGTISEEGAGGEGCLVLTPAGDNGNTDQLFNDAGMILHRAVTGDFDVAFVFREDIVTYQYAGIGFREGSHVLDASVISNNGAPYENGYQVFVYADGSGIVAGTSAGNPAARNAGNGRRVLRLTRVGDVFTFYELNSVAAWRQLGQTTLAWNTTGAVFIGGHRWVTNGQQPKFYVRAFLALTAGALAAPSAPTGGLAFSAPSADDSDLGVGFSWAAPASNVARTVEIQTATNVGFTTGVQRHVVDLLMDGEKPTHRRAGVSLAATIYGRARYVDELGQAGTWSATISAVAAVTPTSGIVYVPGAERIIRRESRVIRRPTT